MDVPDDLAIVFTIMANGDVAPGDFRISILTSDF